MERLRAVVAAGAIVLLSGLGGAGVARADALLRLTFDEIAETQLDPSVTVEGVTFTYTGPAPDAFYNSPASAFGPGDAVGLEGGVLDGDTLGELRIDFLAGTESIELALALSTEEETLGFATLELLDESDGRLALINLATGPGQPGGFSEGFVSFTGSGLIKSAVLRFDPVGAGEVARFAMDNLRVGIQVVPEPGGLALAAGGLASIGLLRRGRARRAEVRAR
jgi:hypothetical protein